MGTTCMPIEKMLVTHALNELKLLEKRITKITGEFTPYAAIKRASDKVNNYTSREDFLDNSISDFCSLRDLIARYRKIKSKIGLSNCSTVIDIAGQKMTVAEAIEYKNSSHFDYGIVSRFNSVMISELNKVTKENAKVESKIESLLTSAVSAGEKVKKDSDIYELYAKPIKEKEEFELLYLRDLEKDVKRVELLRESFLSEVDTALQVSNSTTFIEI